MSIKEQTERAIGDAFINLYYNPQHRTNFIFKARPVEAPDLTYKDGTQLLNIEIGTAYYHKNDAKVQWAIRRGSAEKVLRINLRDFERSIVLQINSVIEDKCGKNYGRQCLLVMYVRPILTYSYEMLDLLKEVNIPPVNPFDGIYLSGDFPDRYCCWRINTETSEPGSHEDVRGKEVKGMNTFEGEHQAAEIESALRTKREDIDWHVIYLPLSANPEKPFEPYFRISIQTEGVRDLDFLIYALSEVPFEQIIEDIIKYFDGVIANIKTT